MSKKFTSLRDCQSSGPRTWLVHFCSDLQVLHGDITLAGWTVHLKCAVLASSRANHKVKPEMWGFLFLFFFFLLKVMMCRQTRRFVCAFSFRAPVVAVGKQVVMSDIVSHTHL
jgi:hypothetical protein